MFFLPQALVGWIASVWLFDWKRFPQLFVYGLWGIVICHLEDQVGYRFGLWAYRDSGPFPTHHDISAIVFTLSAPFLMSIYFTQGLRPRAPIPWGRIAAFTAVSMIPEVIAVRTGHMVHGRWWGWSASVLAYIPTWLSIWWLHRWIGRHHAAH